MADLVLGFTGGSAVHRANAEALLADDIAVHLRDHKGAKVRFVFTTNDFTDTKMELVDYALRQGYKLGLVGHAWTFEESPVDAIVPDAEGLIYKIKSTVFPSRGLVSSLKGFADAGVTARLILIGDPNTDDDAYVGYEEATERGIKVRSLLHGLAEVKDEDVPESTNEEETTDVPRAVEDDELEDEVDDSTLFDDDDLIDGPVDDDDDADVEPDDDDDDDDGYEEGEPEDDGDEDDDGGGDEEDDDVEDLDDVDESDDEETADEEEEEEPVPTSVKRKRKTASAEPLPLEGKTLTEANLTRLGERDKEEFYRLAAEYDVHPGRGMKVGVMVNRILESVNGTAPKKAARTAKKAPARTAKKAARTAPTKKRAAAAEPAQRRRRTTSGTQRTPANNTTGLSKADVAAVADAVVEKLVAHLKRNL